MSEETMKQTEAETAENLIPQDAERRLGHPVVGTETPATIEYE